MSVHEETSRPDDQVRDHEAYVLWRGDFGSGEGSFELGGGAITGLFDGESRLQRGLEVTPEELLGAAHAACFSMTLASLLAQDEYDVRRIRTRAVVRVRWPDSGRASIECTELHTEGDVPGIDASRFRRYAVLASESSVLSRALASTSIRLVAELVSR
jgi:osmotically inducible protein OsmC